MGFEFQLVLTEACNMRCSYCYMKPKPKVMSPEIFDAHFKMLPKMMNMYGQHTYTAALFGGEPLLNWELIEYITPILKADKRCNFVIAMTNGLVLKDKYKRDYVGKHGIALSLSFDGLWNEQNRPLANGKSSLEEYTTEPLKSFFSGKGGCKVMVSPESIDTMVENYKWFVEEFNISSPDFSLVRDDIWTSKDISKFEIEARKLADQMIAYIEDGVQTTVGFFQLYILDLLFGEAYGKRPFGCFAGCNGAAFMPDGSIFPCARFGSNEVFKIGDSIKGTLDQKVIGHLKNPYISNPQYFEQCKACALYKYCNAGCTFQQLKYGSPGESIPVDSICQLLHILYGESIRIVERLKHNNLFRQMIKGSIKNVG